MARNYRPAVFQPTIRPDWGGVLSYIPDNEKTEILIALFKYPSVECSSRFWLETIKPDLDCQYEEFKRQCELKSRGIRERWGKTSITPLEDNYNTCNSCVIVSEGEGEREIEEESIEEIEKVKEKEKNKEKEIEKDFNIFWEAYTPVKATDGYVVAKGSKKVSFEKYVRIIKSGTKPDDILQGLKNYISFCQRNNRLTCGVPVFLNQERWKDEYNTITVIGQAAPPKMSLKEIKETENHIKLQKMLNGEL